MDNKYSGYTRNQQDRILLFERQRSARQRLEALKKEEEKKKKAENKENGIDENKPVHDYARTNQWQSTYEQYGGVAEERDRSILPLIASNDRARKKIPCTNSDYGNFYKMDVDHGKRKYSVERFPYLPPIGDGTITYTPRHNPKQPLSSLDQPLSSRYYDDHNSINLSGIENVDMEIVCHDHTAVNLRSSRDNGYSYTSYPHVSNVHVPDIKDIVLKIKQRDGSVVQVVTSPK